MDLSFDNNGLLKPYKKIEVNFNDFVDVFVQPFDKYSKRHQIINNYKRYIENFKSLVANEFSQLIDGSFVTNKENPNDIDIVTLLDYQIVREKKEILQERFLNPGSTKIYDIDAYIVRMYPEEHPYHVRTVSDLAYWHHWFGYSKLDKKRKRLPKGFIEIKFTPDKNKL